MKKLIFILITALTLTGCSKTESENMNTAILNTSMGEIVIELFPDQAPKTVKNFVELATGAKEWVDPNIGEKVKTKLYDGTIFHRVIPGFVIQGGCPKGDGTGGPGWQVKAEFNKKKHMPGTLSMARSAHPDSAGSQFFVCLTREQCQHLDNQYTAFGQVIKGMDVVQMIAALEVDSRSGRPLKPISMKRVISSAAI